MSPRNFASTLAVPPEPTDHTLGAEHARVVLVEYGDFECPNCKVAAAAPKLLLERFPSRIRFIFRHFPLEQAHPHALLAAEAAAAAAAQGRFWQAHDRLFERQPQLGAKDLQRLAEDLELDMARFTVEMEDHIYLQKVREHLEGGRRSHLRATPTFFLDGAIQDVSFGIEPLHARVAQAVETAYRE